MYAKKPQSTVFTGLKQDTGIIYPQTQKSFFFQYQRKNFSANDFCQLPKKQVIVKMM